MQMKNRFKRILFLTLLITINQSLFTNTAYAVCPVCTVAVGAGLGISRALGIDDAVTSVWIGGLILSMSFWLIDWLRKKKKLEIGNWKLEILVIIIMYLLTLLPLWYGKYIGRPNNTLWGTDKILFGTFAGSIAFMIGKWADQKIREKKGKQLFVYQKVVFPVSALLLTSIFLELIVRNI